MQKNIMVCVTQQKTCERLIHTGYNMTNENDNLYIIHVVNENDKFLFNSVISFNRYWDSYF